MNERRHTEAAGYSWRKWEGLRLKQAKPEREQGWWLRPGLFLLFCVDVGAWGAFIAHSMGLLT